MNSTDPYYSQATAEALRPLLDALLRNDSNGKPLVLSAKEHDKSVNTLYHIVNRAWRFIIDNDDGDGKYKQLRDKCKIEKSVADDCVTITCDLSTTIVEEKEDLNAHWRGVMNSFLEISAKGAVLEMKDLRLSKAEVAEVERIGIGLSGMFDVSVKEDGSELRVRKI